MLKRFPVQLALIALGFYVLTLSWGVTTNSLPLTANVAGWDCHPMISQPLLWLLTVPLRILPEGWVPISLNLLSAVCGAVVVGMLARSVELLGLGRPQTGKVQWPGKLPVVLACLLVGLEFSFWQDATAATGEMLDLLLLAGAIWCLLEYRVSLQLRWLNFAALFWGLGLAENWIMVPLFPFFLAALAWLRRERVLEPKFLMRTGLLLLAGFSVFLLLPLVNGLSPRSPYGFGESWIASFKAARQVFGTIRHSFGGRHLPLTLGVLAFYLLPVLPCLMPSSDESSNNKFGAARLEMWIYRVLRAAVLLACLWLVFDPEMGPRQLVAKHIGLRMRLLSFDYLSALGAGFLAGNLLSALQTELVLRPFNDRLKRLRRWLSPALAVAIVLVATGLVLRNAPAVIQANRQPFSSFGEMAVRSLPSDGGLVFCDNPLQLRSFQAALSRSGAKLNWQTVDTTLLPSPEYRAVLERNHPSGWLTAENHHILTPAETIKLVDPIVRGKSAFYLHPAFGGFFERFYLEPSGAVLEIKPRTADHAGPVSLTAREVEKTEKFWDRAWQSQLEALSRTATGTNLNWPKPVEKFARRFHVTPVALPQNRLLGEWFSASLNNWGVELQRAGLLPEARQRFEQALALNNNNFIAMANYATCTNLLAGNPQSLAGADKVVEWIESPRNLVFSINRLGLCDEPVLCYLLGWAFEGLHLPRQAGQQFERSRALAPDMAATEFALAETYANAGKAEKALELVGHIRSRLTNSMSATNDFKIELSLLEARAWYSLTNPAKARVVLESALQQNPGNDHAMNLVSKTFILSGDLKSAQKVNAARLALRPDDVMLLNNQATLLLNLGETTNAIAHLDRLLAVTNWPVARFNHARAAMSLGDLATAEADYADLEKADVEPVRVQLGLAEIAAQRQDTNLVIQRLTFCVSNATPGSPLWRAAQVKLEALKPGVTMNDK